MRKYRKQFSQIYLSFLLQRRIQRSPPWGIFFGVLFHSWLMRERESPELLCCRASSCEEHSNFILSCNLIGQRENKSFYVTEIVFWLGFADVIFGGTSDSRKYVCVSRLTKTWMPKINNDATRDNEWVTKFFKGTGRATPEPLAPLRRTSVTNTTSHWMEDTKDFNACATTKLALINMLEALAHHRSPDIITCCFSPRWL